MPFPGFHSPLSRVRSLANDGTRFSRLSSPAGGGAGGDDGAGAPLPRRANSASACSTSASSVPGLDTGLAPRSDVGFSLASCAEHSLPTTVNAAACTRDAGVQTMEVRVLPASDFSIGFDAASLAALLALGALALGGFGTASSWGAASGYLPLSGYNALLAALADPLCAAAAGARALATLPATVGETAARTGVWLPLDAAFSFLALALSPISMAIGLPGRVLTGLAALCTGLCRLCGLAWLCRLTGLSRVLVLLPDRAWVLVALFLTAWLRRRRRARAKRAAAPAFKKGKSKEFGVASSAGAASFKESKGALQFASGRHMGKGMSATAVLSAASRNTFSRAASKGRLSAPGTHPLAIRNTARRVSKIFTTQKNGLDAQGKPAFMVQAGETGFPKWARPKGISSYESQPAGTWSVPVAESFHIRSNGYLTTRTKQPSEEPLCKLVAFDVFVTERKLGDLGSMNVLRLPDPNPPPDETGPAETTDANSVDHRTERGGVEETRASSDGLGAPGTPSRLSSNGAGVEGSAANEAAGSKAGTDGANTHPSSSPARRKSFAAEAPTPSRPARKTLDVNAHEAKIGTTGNCENSALDAEAMGELPEILIFNWQLFTYSPSAGSLFADDDDECDGQGGSLVQYYSIPPWLGLRSADGAPPSPAALLLRKWLLTAEEDEAMRNRLKLIVRLDNSSEVSLNAFVTHSIKKYEGKPYMARPAFDVTRGTNPPTGIRFFEIDIDTHRYSYIVKKTMTAMSGNFPQLRFSIAFLIEGRDVLELPECLAGAATCCKFDWTMLKPFPPSATAGDGAGGVLGANGEEEDSDEEDVQVAPAGGSSMADAALDDLEDDTGGDGSRLGTLDPEWHTAMAKAVFERVLPQVRELEEQGAYSAASELLASALIESKRIADQGRESLAALNELPETSAGQVLTRPAAPTEGVARLKQVRAATNQYRGRLYVLTRQVHGMKWRARLAELDGSTLRLFKVTKSGKVQHGKPFLLKDLDEAEVTMVAKSRMVAPTPHVFQLVTPHRTLLFCGEDETGAFAWMHAMRSVATPPPLEAHALRVKPRTRFVLPVRVDSVEAETTFTWSWSVASKDLGFEGYFEAEGEDAQYPTLVIKWTRHVAEDGRMVGSYTARRPGVLMLCWDNTYSVFTPKSLSYTVTKETGAL